MESLKSISSSITSPIQALLPQPAAVQNCLTRDLVVTKLLVHPIKSCKGTSVQSSSYDYGGLEFDRTWLIIDAQSGKFFTARDLPEMVLIHPIIDRENNKLKIQIPLKHKGKDDIEVQVTLIPTREELEKCPLIENVFIWGATHNGYAVSPEADSALSQFFEKSVRLVRKGETQRWPGLDPLKQSSPTAPSGWVPEDFPIGKSQWNLNKAFTRWQDFYPLLIGTETSIEHIRKTLVKTVHPPETPPESDNESSGDMNRPGVYGEKQGDFVHSYPVPKKLNKEEWGADRLARLRIERFRPNIIVADRVTSSNENKDRGLTPFEEDAWTSLEILDPESADNQSLGKSVKGKDRGFYCLARCARCQVPCIDPETAIRDAFIPYRILQHWRIVEPSSKKLGKPCFGMLSVSRENSGIIKVGDLVRVTGVTDPQKRRMGELLPEQKSLLPVMFLVISFFVSLLMALQLSGRSF